MFALKSVRNIAISFAVALIASPAMATDAPQDLPAGAYDMDLSHSSLTWKVSHLGLSMYTARFTAFDADLDFNSQDPAQSSLVVTIDPKSVRTDYPFAGRKDWDAELANDANWFNSGAHPEIKFVSTGMTVNDDKTGKVMGDLTFLGTTKPVELDVTFNAAMKKHPFSGKSVIGFSATGMLKRSQWGMSRFVPTIGDDVTLVIEAEFAKAE